MSHLDPEMALTELNLKSLKEDVMYSLLPLGTFILSTLYALCRLGKPSKLPLQYYTHYHFLKFNFALKTHKRQPSGKMQVFSFCYAVFSIFKHFLLVLKEFFLSATLCAVVQDHPTPQIRQDSPQSNFSGKKYIFG